MAGLYSELAPRYFDSALCDKFVIPVCSLLEPIPRSIPSSVTISSKDSEIFFTRGCFVSEHSNRNLSNFGRGRWYGGETYPTTVYF